ncbi:1-phosphofructokinase [Planococcus antarcticus DSM 14505]|uniref:Tagatose-6-phosphate kinase n=1 Tax=Planococcus antarcticus DSM 14505 TaxID=1185653 RepID=A0ABM6D659_9BACL|nr:1-phosphofructokinase [Planococcus antarcticus]ANU10984.1 1-phosphofructokinase [Planococcus antarcticus DSM 14505]
MIYTCTITPSIDYTVYVPEFESGKLNRSEEVYYYPGGKGINVSRVLKRLGVSNQALGYAGGFTGHYIEEFLKTEGVATDFIETTEITRINVKIKADEETELNGPGPKLTAEQLAVLTEKVRLMNKDDWFVLAGSLPHSIATEYFLELAEICQANQVRFVLDTSGPALESLLTTSVFLAKPNQQELGELFNVEISSLVAAYRYASKLVAKGTQHVIVSMGGDGALLVTKDIALIAKAPQGTVVNTVGSGDSLVSGFIASYAAHQDPALAFRYGVASGSATAFRSDLCRKEDVELLLDQVEIYPFKEKDVTK